MGEVVEAYKGRKAGDIVVAALALYDQGLEIEQAAEELNVPARTIYRWLAANAQEQWHQAQKGRAMADYDGARKRRDSARVVLEGLESGIEGANQEDDKKAKKVARSMNWRLAHAREVLMAADRELDHQKWLLERLLKRIYGQDVEVDGSERITITLNLGPVAEEPRQVIDMGDKDHNP